MAKKKQPEDLASPLLSIDGACRLLHVTRRTIYNWIYHNKVEYVRTAGESIRIRRETLFRDGNVPAEASQPEPQPEP